MIPVEFYNSQPVSPSIIEESREFEFVSLNYHPDHDMYM